MNKLLIFIACLVQLASCFAQQFNCPIENGYLYEYRTHPYFQSDPAAGITIISINQNIIQSAFSGFVLDVLKHGKSNSVIIQKGDTIIAYKNLIKTSFKKGDFVNKGTWFGTIAKSDLGYTLSLTIWVKGERIDARDFFLCLR